MKPKTSVPPQPGSSVEQKAIEYAYTIVPEPHKYDAPYYTTLDRFEDIEVAFIAGYTAALTSSRGAGEGEALTIEQLAEELMDKRIEKYLRDAGVPEGIYWLSRKHIAEDLLDKFHITPKQP